MQKHFIVAAVICLFMCPEPLRAQSMESVYKREHRSLVFNQNDIASLVQNFRVQVEKTVKEIDEFVNDADKIIAQPGSATQNQIDDLVANGMALMTTTNLLALIGPTPRGRGATLTQHQRKIDDLFQFLINANQPVYGRVEDLMKLQKR